MECLHCILSCMRCTKQKKKNRISLMYYKQMTWSHSKKKVIDGKRRGKKGSKKGKFKIHRMVFMLFGVFAFYMKLSLFSFVTWFRMKNKWTSFKGKKFLVENYQRVIYLFCMSISQALTLYLRRFFSSQFEIFKLISFIVQQQKSINQPPLPFLFIEYLA